MSPTYKQLEVNIRNLKGKTKCLHCFDFMNVIKKITIHFAKSLFESVLNQMCLS